MILNYRGIGVLLGIILGINLDKYIERHYPKSWYAKHFCWWEKLKHDENCWEQGYDRIPNK